jgi:hypothetical protein
MTGTLKNNILYNIEAYDCRKNFKMPTDTTSSIPNHPVYMHVKEKSSGN